MDPTRRAIELAEQAWGRVSPRPPVGAVVVSGDRIVGEGCTQPGDGPHAEIVALEAAGRRARGAHLVTTLEPCSHQGATPPCTDAVLRAGVRSVVALARDPNPLVDGLALLRAAGVDARLRRSVRAGRLIEGFTSWVTTGRPFVTLKLAATLDGKVAAPDGTSQWISSEVSRREVHLMRARADAVMVGAGTVATDDPSLTARDVGDVAQPMRVVVDASGRTSPKAPFTVFSTRKRAKWSDLRVEVVDAAEHGVDLGQVLDRLGAMGVCHLLVEGGPTLAASLIDARLTNRVVLYLAPSLIGGDAPGLLSSGVKTLIDAWPLRIERTRRVGPDICIEATCLRD